MTKSPRDMYGEPLAHRRLKLEKFRFNCQQILSGWFVDSEVTIESQAFADQVCAEFQVSVFGERLGRHEVAYPRDWWQAFKLRWFPPWATRRWPVMYEVKEFDAVALYPTYHTKIEGHEVVLALLDHPRWDGESDA